MNEPMHTDPFVTGSCTPYWPAGQGSHLVLSALEVVPSGQARHSNLPGLLSRKYSVSLFMGVGAQLVLVLGEVSFLAWFALAIFPVSTRWTRFTNFIRSGAWSSGDCAGWARKAFCSSIVWVISSDRALFAHLSSSCKITRLAWNTVVVLMLWFFSTRWAFVVE